MFLKTSCFVMDWTCRGAVARILGQDGFVVFGPPSPPPLQKCYSKQSKLRRALLLLFISLLTIVNTRCGVVFASVRFPHESIPICKQIAGSARADGSWATRESHSPVEIPVFVWAHRNPASLFEVVDQDGLVQITSVLHSSHLDGLCPTIVQSFVKESKTDRNKFASLRLFTRCSRG